MSRGVDEIEYVLVPVLGFVDEPGGLEFDSDSCLNFKSLDDLRRIVSLFQK